MNARDVPLGQEEAWAALALGLAPCEPPDDLRARVMASAERAAPYRRFLPRFAACFDLAPAALHDLLARMDDPTAWTPGVGPTLAFLHFAAGPRLSTSGSAPHCGIARMRSGVLVPRHRHRATEITFVLRGTVTDDKGGSFEAGEVLELGPGSAHALRITGEPDALMAVLLSEIEIVTPP